MIPIAYGGSTKERQVSFSAGIDEGLRADLVIAIVIVERDARDVISVTCGGKSMVCKQTCMPACLHNWSKTYFTDSGSMRTATP